MELQIHSNGVQQQEEVRFIESNTQPMNLQEIRQKHIIPVFVKDNTEIVSHTEFIEATQEQIDIHYGGEIISNPSIRMSHPIKGRIPEARGKKATELEEHEKTIYYERMAFLIELPNIKETINGESLSLVIGGIRALNETNLYSVKGSPERFRIFIGFKVQVCTNLCIWTDGFSSDVKVSSKDELAKQVGQMIEDFSAQKQLASMEQLMNTVMSESEFAQMIGRSRLYNYLPKGQKVGIQPLLLGDNQISQIAKGYYGDENFSGNGSSINLWNLYNLFTDAVKSSYIDKFLDRNVNSFEFVKNIESALVNKQDNWFLS